MLRLAKKLFPICRSITGNGQLETLETIKMQIPLNILEYETGEEYYDWKIPLEWNINGAYIQTESGEKIVDFKNSNLHVAGYSVPYEGTISFEELKKHIHFREDLPEAIPYVTYYHKSDWAFCMSKNQFDKLRRERYTVKIESSLTNGYLRIGEYLKKGKSKKEIWFSTYTCHPSLCNDNLSGIIAGVELVKYLESIGETKYSYRVLFLPETIGPIVYLNEHQNIIDNILGGYVLTHCGDKAPLTYKKSIAENHDIDNMLLRSLERLGKQYSVQPYLPLGSDERQYSSPRFNLAFGSLMRSSHTPKDISNPFQPDWKEYHTSLDNLDLLSIESLTEVIEVYIECIRNHELNAIYKGLYYGEPMLSKHGLYVDPTDDLETAKAVFYFQGFSNGTTSLWDIHDKTKVDINLLAEVASKFEACELVEIVD